MRKKSLSCSKTFKWVIVYRDELEEIYNVLKSVSPEIKLEADEYEFDNIKELDELKTTKIKVLTMQTNCPYIKVMFREKSFATLDISNESDIVQYGCASRIEKVITANCNKYKSWYFNHRSLISCMGIPLFLVLFFTLQLISYGLIDLTKAAWPNYILWLFTAWIPLPILHMIIPGDECKIYTKYKATMPGFFKRKKDDILLNTFFTVIGFILGYLFAK